MKECVCRNHFKAWLDAEEAQWKEARWAGWGQDTAPAPSSDTTRQGCVAVWHVTGAWSITKGGVPGGRSPPGTPGSCTARHSRDVDFHKVLGVFQWFLMSLNTHKRQVHLGVCCGGV